MVVIFKDINYFRSNTTHRQLEATHIAKRYLVYGQIPRQMESIELGKHIKSAVQMIKNTVYASYFIAITFNVLILMGISYVWGLINSLQMVLYLPICEIIFPSNIMMLYGVFIPLSKLDIIPEEVT